MKRIRTSLLALLATFACAGSAFAHHVVYLDFSDFDLGAWTSVNGNTPATSSDEEAIEDQILVEMAKDYAAFDVYFTTFEPNYGRFTRVIFHDDTVTSSTGTTFGCAGGGCCANGNCTGTGSWDDQIESACEVYSGSFSTLSSLQSSNATTSRIATAIAHTASHELGHVLGLGHENAADDSVTLGCTAASSCSTSDGNVNWHIMSSGKSWGLTSTQRATRDRFFSIHASKRLLLGELQPMNHFAPLGNINGGVGRSDLLYGRFTSTTATQFTGLTSTSSSFGNEQTWSPDSGKAGYIYRVGDVDGDGKDDLVFGGIKSSDQVKWYVRTSTGSDFADSYAVWRNDAGDVGDIFRLADVDGDGKDDLVYGRPLDETTVRWYVRLSNGSGFGSASTWVDDAGSIGHIFMLGDLGGDGDADLLYGSIKSASQVKWYGRFSNGHGFTSYQVWRDDAGDQGDMFYLGDVDGDGDADLVYGRAVADTQVRFYGRRSTGNEFSTYSVLKDNAGNAGDLHRIGDGDADGKMDLFYGRNRYQDDLSGTPDPTEIMWFGRLSTGFAYGDWSIWANDAGDDGDIFP